MIRTRFAAAALCLGLISACGGSSGGSSSTPVTPPDPVTFTASGSFSPVMEGLFTGPLLERALIQRIDEDPNPDFFFTQSALFMGNNTEEHLTMSGDGVGGFSGNLGGGGYNTDEHLLLAAGDVLGPGEGGGAFAAPDPSGFAWVVTRGQRTVGMTIMGVGGAAVLVSSHVNSIAVGDWNGDTTDDVAVCDDLTPQIGTWPSNGLTGLGTAAPVALPMGSMPHSLVAINVDGDTDDDLAFADDAVGFRVLLCDGMGGFSLVPSPGSLGGAARTVGDLVSGDFDGDGTADLGGVMLETGFPHRLFTMHGNGDGTFQAPVLTSLPAGLAGAKFPGLAAADFNLDGKADVAFADPASSSVFVYLSNGAGGFVQNPDPALTAASGHDWIAVGDVDLDGDPDIVVLDHNAFGARVILNDKN
jgi:hypothetical protein